MKTSRNPRLFYGYIVVVAAVSILTLSWGANRSFGVFLEPMLDDFGWTRASISGAFTLSMAMYGLLSIVAGRISDRFGPQILLIGCGVFLGLGYLLSSQVTAVWQFYVFYGLITGVGLSGCHAPLFTVIARWFTKRRALMSGIAAAGPTMGILVMPVAFSFLISAHGWRLSYIFLGGIVLLVLIPAALFLKRDPSESGVLPFGSDKAKLQNTSFQAEGASLSEAIRTRQFWLLNIIAFFDTFLINVIVVHIVIHATDLGIANAAAATILSVAAGVSIPARIIIGGVADRIGNRPALIIILVASVVAFSLLLITRELWMFYLFAFLYGIGLWSSIGILPPLMADLFGLKSHATIFSFTVLAGAIGGALGPVLAGYIFDVTGTYQLAFIICLVGSIIALIASIMVRPVTRR